MNIGDKIYPKSGRGYYTVVSFNHDVMELKYSENGKVFREPSYTLVSGEYWVERIEPAAAPWVWAEGDTFKYEGAERIVKLVDGLLEVWSNYEDSIMTGDLEFYNESTITDLKHNAVPWQFEAGDTFTFNLTVGGSAEYTVERIAKAGEPNPNTGNGYLTKDAVVYVGGGYDFVDRAQRKGSNFKRAAVWTFEVGDTFEYNAERLTIGWEPRTVTYVGPKKTKDDHPYGHETGITFVHTDNGWAPVDWWLKHGRNFKRAAVAEWPRELVADDNTTLITGDTNSVVIDDVTFVRLSAVTNEELLAELANRLNVD